MEGMSKSDKAKEKIWEEQKSQIRYWYVTTCSKLYQEEVEKTVGEYRVFWLEPIVADIKNPMLVMGIFEGKWAIKREPIERNPRIWVP